VERRVLRNAIVILQILIVLIQVVEIPVTRTSLAYRSVVSATCSRAIMKMFANKDVSSSSVHSERGMHPRALSHLH
jgi:hypothetical protein